MSDSRQTANQDHRDSDLRPFTLTPLHILALSMLAGTALALWIDLNVWWWLGLALPGMVMTTWMWRRQHSSAARNWALISLLMLAGAWCTLDRTHLSRHDVAHLVSEDSVLAFVEGMIESEPRLRQAQRGAFADFGYQPPATSFFLRVERVKLDGDFEEVHGRVLVRIRGADHRVRQGMRVRALGWLAAFHPPSNPGEHDIPRRMRELGVGGRLSLASSDNWQLLDAPRATSWMGIRAVISDNASAALRAGLEDNPTELALLQTILLGRWNDDATELGDAFRQVGLIHLLTISGAHLGMLMYLVWAAARVLLPRPSHAAWAVLFVLMLYLLTVPATVPIMRAGIMATCFCLGHALGREVRGIDTLALALIIVLIWRPVDLATGGFQLSFGLVAAMMLLGTPVSARLLGEMPVMLLDTAQMRWRKRVIEFVSINLIAGTIAMPLVAYHFQTFSPLAPLLTMAAFPLMGALLGVGYIKIIVGLLLPSMSLVLSGPLAWLSQSAVALVREAATWPASHFSVSPAPSAVWTLATLALLVAWMAGWMRDRKLSLGCAAACCALWLWVPLPAWMQEDRADAIQINMLAVRDGSCFVIRIPGERERVMMFDCGSQQSLDVGRISVVPALRSMGITKIDTLFVSHADLDHYAGVLEVVQEIGVLRIATTPQFLAEAEDAPNGAAHFLVEQLQGLGLTPEVISAGWQQQVGDVQIDALWPDADFRDELSNNSSLVLRFTYGSSRLLMVGDLQAEGMSKMLGDRSFADIDADVMELPHHGSFIPEALRWVEAAQPRLVLQSTGMQRLRRDRWPMVLDSLGTQRLVTERSGMAEVRMYRDGAIDWETFHPAEHGRIVR